MQKFKFMNNYVDRLQVNADESVEVLKWTMTQSCDFSTFNVLIKWNDETYENILLYLSIMLLFTIEVKNYEMFYY